MAITRREKHIIRVIKFYEPPLNTVEEDLNPGEMKIITYV